MNKCCDKCGKKGTVFYIKPGGVYLCPKCEKCCREHKAEK